MKVAIPLFRKRISPNFLTAPELLVILAQGQKVSSTFLFRFSKLSLFERRKKLISLGIDLLICGGIDWPTKFCLEKHGTRVIDNTMGEVGEILSHLHNIPKWVRKEERTKAREKPSGKENRGGTHEKNPLRR